METTPATFLARAGDVIGRAAQRVDLTSGDAPDFAYYTALPGPVHSFTHVRSPTRPPASPRPRSAGSARRRPHLVPVGLAVNHLYVDGADLGDLYDGLVDSFARAF